MSGSDRIVVHKKRRPRARLAAAPQASRAPAMSNANAGELRRNDAHAEHFVTLSQAMAVKALGPDKVRQAERLRAKGWSVTGIARHTRTPGAIIAALFGVALGAAGGGA